MKQVLAATQTPGEAGKKWFQGTADAVRQFTWVFEVGNKFAYNALHSTLHLLLFYFQFELDLIDWLFQDAKNTNVENVLILAGDHLYRMDYMDLVEVYGVIIS